MKVLSKNKKSIKYFIAFIIPFIVLVSMTIIPMITSILGDEILIETKPIDPTDVFRGDYVRLEYEISEIDINKLDDKLKGMVNDYEYNYYKDLRKKKLYVSLVKTNNYYVVDKVSFDKPNNGIYLTAKYIYTLRDYNKDKEINNIKGISIDYSLDKYFVPENTGVELEEKSRQGQLLAKLKVFKGYALLIDIMDK